MRITHFIETLEGEPDGPTLGLLRDLLTSTSAITVQTRLGTIDHRVVVFGPTRLCQKIQGLGVQVDGHLDCRMGGDLSACLALRRWSNGEGLEAARGEGIIHTWSVRGAGWVESSLPKAKVVTTLAHTPVGRVGGRWYRAWRRGQSICWTLNEKLGAWAANQGVPDSRIELLGPVIDATHLKGIDRGVTRRKWGVNGGIAVAILGDTPAGTDALAAYQAVLLAEGTGEPFRMLIDPRSHDLDRAQKVMVGQDRGRTILPTSDMDRPWESLACCDLALHLGGSIGLGWAMAAGLGIVTTEHCGSSNGLGRVEATGYLEAQQPGHAGRQLLKLHQDKALANQIGQAAKDMVSSRLSPERWAPKMLELYERLQEGDSQRGPKHAERSETMSEGVI